MPIIPSRIPSLTSPTLRTRTNDSNSTTPSAKKSKKSLRLHIPSFFKKYPSTTSNTEMYRQDSTTSSSPLSITSTAFSPALTPSSSATSTFSHSHQEEEEEQQQTQQSQIQDRVEDNNYEKLQEQGSADTINDNSTSNNVSQIHQNLPENWEIRYDPVLQMYYYVDLVKMVVQFDNPLEVLIKN